MGCVTINTVEKYRQLRDLFTNLVGYNFSSIRWMNYKKIKTISTIFNIDVNKNYNSQINNSPFSDYLRHGLRIFEPEVPCTIPNTIHPNPNFEIFLNCDINIKTILEFETPDVSPEFIMYHRELINYFTKTKTDYIVKYHCYNPSLWKDFNVEIPFQQQYLFNIYHPNTKPKYTANGIPLYHEYYTKLTNETIIKPLKQNTDDVYLISPNLQLLKNRCGYSILNTSLYPDYDPHCVFDILDLYINKKGIYYISFNEIIKLLIYQLYIKKLPNSHENIETLKNNYPAYLQKSIEHNAPYDLINISSDVAIQINETVDKLKQLTNTKTEMDVFYTLKEKCSYYEDECYIPILLNPKDFR